MKFFTMWLCGFGTPDGSQCVLWFVLCMQRDLYLLNYCNYVRVKYVTRVSVLFPGTVVRWLGSWLLCPLWLYGSPVFTFPVDGGRGGGVCPLVLCSLLLLSVLDRLRLVQLVFLWGACRLLRAVINGPLSLCSFHFLRGWMASHNTYIFRYQSANFRGL